MCAMPAKSSAASRNCARVSNGGLIVSAPHFHAAYHDLIVTLSAQHHLPAVYASPSFVTAGGLCPMGLI